MASPASPCPAPTPPPAPTPTPYNGIRIRPNLLSIRDSLTDPTKRSFSFKSSYAGGVSSHVTPPRPQFSDDPTLQGGQLWVWSPDKATPPMRIELFSQYWKLGGSAGSPMWTYKAPDGSISITLKAEKLVIKAKGASVFSLAGAPQGRVAIQLKLGLEAGLCTVSNAGLSDGTVKFDGVLNGSRPSVCATIPG